MIILVGLLLITIIVFVFLVTRKKTTKVAQDFSQSYSVKEYLERIEEENLCILMERKNKKPYITILWLGLDGLRINNDSSLEWISKNTTLPEKNFCNINASSIINTIQYDNISSQVCDTRSAIQGLELSQVQTAQNALILAALNSSSCFYYGAGPSSVVTVSQNRFN